MTKNEITTIKLNKKTKSRLDKLRTHKRESYDEIAQRILNIMSICRISPLRAQSRLRGIEAQIRRNKIRGGK